MSENEKTEKAKLEIAEGDENPERGNWSGKLDFLLSCLGYAVGLGNVWRFPYLCFKHGGGAFLVPYALMLLFIGIPAFLLELTLGQYSALGPVTVYSNLAPLFKGLGFANFMASCMVGLYYNMIIAWTIYYMFSSFTSKLPWEDCGQDFNSDFCFSITDYANCTKWRNETGEAYVYHKGKCIVDKDELRSISQNDTYVESLYSCKYEKKFLKDPENACSAINHTETVKGIYENETSCVEYTDASQLQSIKNGLFDIPFGIRKTAAQEYLENSVLNESDGIENMGSPQWWLVLCLLAAWIVIFLCLIKGIKSSGRVVYFTATFPYVILVILLIRAVTLPGAYDGIKFYMVPDWSRLSDIKVWEGAAVQIFFSLSVAGGGLVTLASYNKFHNNVVRDTLIVCFGNCLTSVFAGFAIFSILGFLALELGVDVEDVVKGGTGLAFIAYPDLVTRLPISPLWAILFFAMLFTLGFDSQFAIIETVLTGILDFAPKWRPKKTMIVGIVCTVGFICGLPLTCPGGGYLLDLLDYYAAGWPYLFIGLCEFIIISYVYGVQNYFDDLYHMTKLNPGMWGKSHLVFIYMTLSPLIITVILIFSWTGYEPLTKGDYEYPPYANGLGWLIAMIAILSVPFVAIYQIIYKMFVEHKDIGNFGERLSQTFDDLLHHTPEWRRNAERATRRDNMALNGTATSANGMNQLNGLSNGKNGFENQAMSNEERIPPGYVPYEEEGGNSNHSRL